jgi:hypothetical protein
MGSGTEDDPGGALAADPGADDHARRVRGRNRGLMSSLSSISMFQADSATSTTRDRSEMSRVSIAATPRCSSHLPMPMRTVKSAGLPAIVMVVARCASMTPAFSLRYRHEEELAIGAA